MNLEFIKQALKPYIKPGIENFNKYLVDLIENAQKELQLKENEEVVIIIAKRKDKAIITSAIADENNQIRFSKELNKLTIEAQPLSTFILRNLKF